MRKLGRGTNSAVTGSWCWIKETNGDEEIVIMLMSGKLWEIMTYLLSFCVYMMLKFNTYQERKKDSSYIWSSIQGADLRDEDERFCFTWLILYVLRFWGTIRFFIAISEGNSGKILKYFQCAGDGAQALGNFLLFCVCDKNIRRKYRKLVAGWCKNKEQNLFGNSSTVNYRSMSD
ncbi:G-protein coupled receptor 157-like [Crassostrea virginica]